MRNCNEEPHEYDNYPIPPYNPNLSDEERKKKKNEGIKKLDEVVEQIRKEVFGKEQQ